MYDSSNLSPQQSLPPPLPSALPPRPTIEVHRGVSPIVVILICLLLGMALAWGYGGERASWHMANQLDQAQTHLTATRAHQSDLMAMLSDPATRIVPLQASKTAGEATAVVVLDPTARRGMLLCQSLWTLPQGQTYHLKAGAGRESVELATFMPARGVTAIPFHIPSDESLSSFELWAGASGTAAASAPLFTAPRS